MNDLVDHLAGNQKVHVAIFDDIRVHKAAVPSGVGDVTGLDAQSTIDLSQYQ